MKLDQGGSTELVHFHADEAKEIMKEMEQAEKAGDLEVLRSCARRIVWIYKMMLNKDGTCRADTGTLFRNGEDDVPVYSVNQFNEDYLAITGEGQRHKRRLRNRQRRKARKHEKRAPWRFLLQWRG